MKIYRLTMMTKYSTIIELYTDSDTGARIIDTWGNAIKFPNIVHHDDKILVAPHYKTFISGDKEYYPAGEKYIKTDTIVDIHLVVVEDVEIVS